MNRQKAAFPGFVRFSRCVRGGGYSAAGRWLPALPCTSGFRELDRSPGRRIRRPSYSLAIVKTRVVFVLAGDRAISSILADLCPARRCGGREMLTPLLVRLIWWLSLGIRTAGEVSR